MLSSRCSLSRCFFCSFSRALQSGRKECSSVCFNEDIRDMSFSPNTKRNAFTENTKSATEENRFITSRKSLSSFRSFSRSLSRLSFRSLSFSSRKAFVVVPLLKDLVAKRERFAVKLCFRSEIHTQNSGSSVLPRNQPRGIQRIVCQRFEHYWCSATNSSGLVFVFFFARKVCSRWSYHRE